MKKLLLVCSVMLTVFMGVQAQSFDSERVEGFRELKWGCKLDSCYRGSEKITFTKVKDPDPIINNAYTIATDPMNIGNVPLDRLYYVFNQENRLQKILLEGKKEDFDEVRFILEYKFGEPIQEYRTDNRNILEWQIFDVKFQLINHQYKIFGLLIESDFEELEAYRKNTNVNDF